MGREIGSEPVFGLRPGFRRIRSGGEFHPGEITETAPAEEKKSTGAASASCADGRPARTCDQNHRRARTRGIDLAIQKHRNEPVDIRLVHLRRAVELDGLSNQRWCSTPFLALKFRARFGALHLAPSCLSRCARVQS